MLSRDHCLFSNHPCHLASNCDRWLTYAELREYEGNLWLGGFVPNEGGDCDSQIKVVTVNPSKSLPSHNRNP